LGELILESAPAYGDAVAFQARRGFRLERVTFSQAAARARQVAGWLVARGLASGDRLAAWAPNMPEYAVLYFGAWLARLVVVPIDVRTPQDIVRRFVAAAEPRLGFKSRYLEGTFGPPVEATCNLEDLFELVKSTPPLVPLPRIDPDRGIPPAKPAGSFPYGGPLFDSHVHAAGPFSRADGLVAALERGAWGHSVDRAVLLACPIPGSWARFVPAVWHRTVGTWALGKRLRWSLSSS
jgi:hypothetical protein